MSNERKDGTGDGDEALWTLLGQARRTEASPYFSRRVLREVALLSEVGARRGGWPGWLRGAWRRPRAAVWPGAVVVAVFWVSVVLTTNTPATHAVKHTAPTAAMAASPVQADAADAPEVASADDVEVIADLDNMISREENRLWTEDIARF